jgi:hypothetical protein
MTDIPWGETVAESDMTTATRILQEAPLDTPTVRVIGKLNDGESVVVKPEWTTNGAITLSKRTISALEKIGITVDDNPDNYVF